MHYFIMFACLFVPTNLGKTGLILTGFLYVHVIELLRVTFSKINVPINE